MVDVGRNHNHYWMTGIVHIDFCIIIGTTDGHYRVVCIWIDHLESLHHIRGGQPVGIAGLRGLELDHAGLTCQRQDIAINRSGAIHQLKRDRQA